MLEKGVKAMNINKVVLLGNLVRDPQTKELPSGQMIATFTLATQHSWRDIKTKERKQSVEFHKVLAWGKLAEIIGKYLKKGQRIYLEGRLQSRRWKDKDGRYHERAQVIADNMIMLGSARRKKENHEEVVSEEVSIEEVPTDE
jgi:single-strand DNA-binding protein